MSEIREGEPHADAFSRLRLESPHEIVVPGIAAAHRTVTRRRVLRIGVVAMLLVGAMVVTGYIVGGIGGRSEVEHWTGGPVTPSVVQITINPSARPIGDAILTGMAVRGHEMVLYLWGRPIYLMADWRDTKSGEVTEQDPVRLGFVGLNMIWSEPFWFAQYDPDDGTVIEVGFLRGSVARVTSEDHGHVVEAKFTQWSHDSSVTIFWLRREGSPYPPLRLAGDGAQKPADAEQYPLITAFDASGTVIAQARLRPTGTRPPDG